MRVLHLLSSTGVHGAETMAIELVRQLRALDAAPHVGLIETRGDAAGQIRERVAGDAAECVLIPCSSQLDARVAGFLRRYSDDRGIDVVHTHGYKADFYALWSRRRAPVRLVATCHNWLGRSLKMRLYAALDKRLLRYFDAVAGVSADVTTELRRHVAHAKVHKIGNGVDPATFRRVMPIEQAKERLGLAGKRVVGFIGRLTREKGISELLQAAATLRAAHAGLHVLIVGDGDERAAFEHEARTLGVADCATFAGTRADTPLIYSALDVFALPSYQEGFPMVILEAMACGLPIVSTGVGDIPLIIEHGASGLLTAPGDVTGLAKALDDLLAHPPKALALGTAAARRVSQRHTSRVMAQSYLDLYRAVCARA